MTSLLEKYFCYDGSGATLYDQLGVPNYSSIAVCSRAYRKLMLQFHPDKGTSPKEDSDMKVKKSKWLNEIIEFLRDPKMKAQYDDQLRKQYEQFEQINNEVTDSHSTDASSDVSNKKEDSEESTSMDTTGDLIALQAKENKGTQNKNTKKKNMKNRLKKKKKKKKASSHSNTLALVNYSASSSPTKITTSQFKMKRFLRPFLVFVVIMLSLLGLTSSFDSINDLPQHLEFNGQQNDTDYHNFTYSDLIREDTIPSTPGARGLVSSGGGENGGGGDNGGYGGGGGGGNGGVSNQFQAAGDDYDLLEFVKRLAELEWYITNNANNDQPREGGIRSFITRRARDAFQRISNFVTRNRRRPRLTPHLPRPRIRIHHIGRPRFTSSRFVRRLLPRVSLRSGNNITSSVESSSLQQQEEEEGVDLSDETPLLIPLQDDDEASIGSSNVGSRVSDGSNSPLFSDPVEESTSPSGSYTLDPYQADPNLFIDHQEQQLAATIRGGATNVLMSESDELLLNDDEASQGSQLMAEENHDIYLQAVAAENQGSALLGHMEDMPDQPTSPATDNPSSPSEQTKRRRTGGLGCISNLARPVASGARSIARHSGSAASAIRNSPIGRRVSSAASRLGMRPRDSMALDSPAGSESSTNDAEWTLDDEAIDVAITDMDIDEGLIDGLMSDIEMSFGGIDIESEIDDEPVVTGKQECARATTDIGRLLLKVFDLLGFGNQDFVSAALELVESGEEGFELTEAASFREFLIDITKRVLQRFDYALFNPHNMDVDDVERAVNQDRDDIFDKMWETLPDDRPRINASHPHSRSTMGIAGLHYSPDGTPQIDKHTMPYNQCCVRGIINSVTRAVFYAINAPEKSEAEYNNAIQGIDMACTTAIKKKKFADLESQYWKDAQKLGLKSVQEYYLINMLEYINSHTLFMVANKGNNKKMMTIVASSALAKEVFGKNTKQRFVEKIEKVKSIVYFTLHPQALMMGQGKSKHYDEFRSTMNEHVLTFYAHMLDCTYEDVQPELREFFEWFGKDWIDNDIEMGILSLLAKHMADQGELSVSNINSIKESNIVDEGIKKLFDNQKKLHGEDKLMKLLRRFRAGHFLQTLASQLNADGYEDITISSLARPLTRDIKKVAKILDLTENQVLSRLKRIKKNQVAGGKRLSLINKLAYKLDKFGVDSIKEELGELTTLLKPGSNALQMVQQQLTRLKSTFNHYYNLLVDYIETHGSNKEKPIIFDVDGKDVLIVRESTSPSSDLDRLALWWRDQINLTGRAEQKSDYGILAFTDPTSEYYTKLDDLRAFTFDTALVNRAIEMSHINKQNSKKRESWVDGMINIGDGFEFGKKDKGKKPKRKKRGKKQEDNDNMG